MRTSIWGVATPAERLHRRHLRRERLTSKRIEAMIHPCLYGMGGVDLQSCIWLLTRIPNDEPPPGGDGSSARLQAESPYGWRVNGASKKAVNAIWSSSGASPAPGQRGSIEVIVSTSPTIA